MGFCSGYLKPFKTSLSDVIGYYTDSQFDWDGSNLGTLIFRVSIFVLTAQRIPGLRLQKTNTNKSSYFSFPLESV